MSARTTTFNVLKVAPTKALVPQQINAADKALLSRKRAEKQQGHSTAALIGDYFANRKALNQKNQHIVDAETAAFSRSINQLFAEDTPEPLEAMLPINPKNKELFDKIKDGKILSSMLNAVKGGKAEAKVDMRKINKQPKNTWQYTENLNRVITAASNAGCVTVNMGAEDILNANETLGLGLIWQMVRMKLMQNITLKACPFLIRLMREGETLQDLMKLSPEELLLRWFNYHLSRSTSTQAPMQVKNFGKDLKNSMALTFLIRQLQWQVEQMQQEQPLECSDVADVATAELDGMPMHARAEGVIDEALQAFGVKTFIDADDICAGRERLNLAFVAQIFNKCPGLTATDEEIAMLSKPLTSANRKRCRRAFGHMQKVMQDYRLATQIQAGYRGFACRKNFLLYKTSAIHIQRVARGVFARQEIRAWHAAAARIQACYRGHVQRVAFLHAKASATQIQAGFRGFLVRGSYLLTRDCVVTIQSAERGASVRREIRAWHAAATKIQACYRGHVQRVAFLHAKASATQIQAGYRGFACRKNFLLYKTSAIHIQRVARGVFARQEIRAWHAAAAKIQACYRGHVQRVAFLHAKASATQIQSLSRGVSVRRQFAASIAAVAAAFFAAVAASKAADAAGLAFQHRAATQIQAGYRGFACRKNFLLYKTSAIHIQRVARGVFARQEIRAWHAAATKIQACYRGHVQRVAFLHAKASATQIQAGFRGFLVRSVQHYGFVRKQNVSQLGFGKSMKKNFFLFHAGRLYYSSCGSMSTIRQLLSFGCTLGQMKSVVLLGVADWEGAGNFHKYKHGLELTVEDKGATTRQMFVAAATTAEKACWKRKFQTFLRRNQEVDFVVGSRDSVQNFRDAKFDDVVKECNEHFARARAEKRAAKEARKSLGNIPSQRNSAVAVAP